MEPSQRPTAGPPVAVGDGARRAASSLGGGPGSGIPPAPLLKDSAGQREPLTLSLLKLGSLFRLYL